MLKRETSPQLKALTGEFEIILGELDDVGQVVKIIIDDQRTRVSSLKSNDPRQTINVDTGAAMVHAR